MYNISKTCQIQNLNKIYEKYFGYRSSGHFVEVGAYDGESFSNTSCLADSGWQGLYIEPIKDFYLHCIDRHKNNNVICENYAIGPEENIKEIIKYGPLSTLSDRQYEMFKTVGWIDDAFATKETCNIIRLDKLMEKNGIPKEFDLLVVDTEGNENEVFKSFDLNIWKPKMMIVEIEDEHESFQQFKKYVFEMETLTETLINYNYKIVYKDQINTIFIKK